MKRTIAHIVKGVWIRFLNIAAKNALPRSVRVFLHRLRGVKIGQNTFIGKNVYIDDNNPHLVKIGDNVGVAMGVTILTHRRDLENYSIDKGYNDYPFIELPVEINDNCQIGVNSILLPGITIGNSSVIGAGAVVTKNIPAYSVAVGVPAKVVKTFNSTSS